MWFRVDDGFVEHPKVLAAGAQLSGPRGVGRVVAVWLEAATYCSRRLTDGYVPERVVERLLTDDAPFEVADALLAVGLWIEAPGGFRFHDWADYQPDGDQVRQRRERERKRKQASRHPEAVPRETADASAECPRGQPSGQPADTTECPRGQTRARARARPDPKDQDPKDQKQESRARGRTCTPRYLRLPLTVWEVRSHVLAAVHHLLDQGAPYADLRGVPQLAELRAEVKAITGGALHAAWTDGELEAIVNAAIARREQQAAAAIARERFRQTEARRLAELRFRTGEWRTVTPRR